MAIRQLCKQVSFAVVFVTAVLVGVSTPAGANGASACGGDLNVSVETHLVAGQSVTVPVPGTLEPGYYQLIVKTLDQYEGRELDTEPNEQVSLSVDGLGHVGTTPDLADLIGYADAISWLAGREITTSPGSVTLTHVGGDGPNGLLVRCVGFKLAEPPPPPPPPKVVDLDISAVYDCLRNEVQVLIDNNGDSAYAEIVINGVGAFDFLPPVPGQRHFRSVDPGAVEIEVFVDGELIHREVGLFECPEPEPDPIPVDPDDPDDPDGDDPDGGDPDAGGPGDGGDPGTGGGTGGGGSSGGSGSGGGTGGGGGGTIDPTGPLVSEPTPGATLELSLVCQSNSVRARVSTVGLEPMTATIALVRSERPTAITLEPDTTTTVTLPLPDASEGETAEVVLVTADGDVITGQLSVDCLSPAEPEIDIVVDCAARTLAVVVSNAGEESTQVSAFAEQRALLGSDRLAGGDSAVFEIDLAGPVIPVRVVGEDGTDLLREEIEHGCAETDVLAEAALVCPAGEIELVLQNTGSGTRTVDVSFQETMQAVVIAGGETITLARGFDVGTSVELLVTSELGDVLLDKVVQAWACDRDDGAETTSDPCADPSSTSEWTVVTDGDESCDGLSVRLVVDCASGEVLAVFTNESAEPTDVVIEIDGRVVDTATVDAWATLEGAGSGVAGQRVAARLADDSAAVLDAETDCRRDPDRTLAVLSGLIIGLMSIVTGVVARFDPWMRV